MFHLPISPKATTELNLLDGWLVNLDRCPHTLLMRGHGLGRMVLIRQKKITPSCMLIFPQTILADGFGRVNAPWRSRLLLGYSYLIALILETCWLGGIVARLLTIILVFFVLYMCMKVEITYSSLATSASESRIISKLIGSMVKILGSVLWQLRRALGILFLWSGLFCCMEYLDSEK